MNFFLSIVTGLLELALDVLLGDRDLADVVALHLAQELRRVRDVRARLLVGERRCDPVVDDEQRDEDRPQAPAAHRRLRRGAAPVGVRADVPARACASSCSTGRGCGKRGFGSGALRRGLRWHGPDRTSRPDRAVRRRSVAAAAPKSSRESCATRRALASEGSRCGSALPSSSSDVQVPPTKAAVAAQVHAQDRAQRERAARAEVLVAREVAERVGDQPPVVALHAADHVRARADDEVGARIDRRRARSGASRRGSRPGTSRCRAGRASRPSPRRRRAWRRRRGRPAVAALRTSACATLDLLEPRGPLVGREAEQRDAQPVAAHDRDLPGAPRPAHARRPAARARSSAGRPCRSRRRGCWRGSRRRSPPPSCASPSPAAPGTRSSSTSRRTSCRGAPRASPRGSPKARSALRSGPTTAAIERAAAVGRHAVLRREHRVADPGDRDAAAASGPASSPGSWPRWSPAAVVGSRAGRWSSSARPSSRRSPSRRRRVAAPGGERGRRPDADRSRPRRSSAAPVTRRRRTWRRRSSARARAALAVRDRCSWLDLEGDLQRARRAGSRRARRAGCPPSASANSSPARTGASSDQASVPAIVATRSPRRGCGAASAGAGRARRGRERRRSPMAARAPRRRRRAARGRPRSAGRRSAARAAGRPSRAPSAR